MPTIDYLFEHAQLSLDEIAAQSGVPRARIEAIAAGRWTPSPDERRRIAGVFGIDPADIGWGHTLCARNIRYRRFGMPDGDTPG